MEIKNKQKDRSKVWSGDIEAGRTVTKIQQKLLNLNLN